jgi:hypothetical protein
MRDLSSRSYRFLRERFGKHQAWASASEETGVALVITLLLLFLLSAMSLAMVLATGSDMLINGYYRNSRGAFYAADSGLNVARQQLINQVNAAIPSTFTAGTAPIPAGTEATVQSYITTNYGTFKSLNTGQGTGSWKGSFEITNATFGNALPSPGYTVTATDPTTHLPTGYQYIYNYSLTSVGTAAGMERATVSENGSITFNVAVTPANPLTVSFSAWGMFIDQYPVCSGSYLVPGLISGPVFTNGGWTFGTTGSYTFTDPVGSHSPTAGFQFSSCYTSTAGSMTKSGQTINPQYQGGFLWGQPAITLPPNDFSQKRAVLDGLGTNTAAVTNTDLHNALRDVSGTQYPSGGAASGVYLAYDPAASPQVNGGGIYVKGDAQVTLTASGTSAQVFAIKQGTTTTTITVDPVANTTVITSGAGSQTLTGVPHDLNTGKPGTMLYVDGNITSLTGPHDASGNPLPAIQDGAAVTVTANSNITITGDVQYKTKPVTTTQNEIPGTPADTLIPGNDKGQVLGIFTANGNIQLANAQSSRNLRIDASMATIKSGGSGGIVNTGSAINTLTIIGGRIQNTIQNINTTTRNVFFDRRFSGSLAPPWFPATTVTPAGLSSATTTPTVQRVQWINSI